MPFFQVRQTEGDRHGEADQGIKDGAKIHLVKGEKRKNMKKKQHYMAKGFDSLLSHKAMNDYLKTAFYFS